MFQAFGRSEGCGLSVGKFFKGVSDGAYKT